MSENIFEELQSVRLNVEYYRQHLDQARKSEENCFKIVKKYADKIANDRAKNVEECLFRLRNAIDLLDRKKAETKEIEYCLWGNTECLRRLERKLYAANVGPNLTYDCDGRDLDVDRLLKGFIKGTKL